MSLFPMFVKLARRGGLAGRDCLVVGAGKISEGKVSGLLEAGAKVRVVAPSATEEIAEWHHAKKIVWKKRKYEKKDLRGAFLVVAATNSEKVHKAIFRDAQKAGVLCNIVDVPELCDFYYPSVVRRGDLQIAVSTAGASPMLAKRLRQKFEREFGSEYSEWLKELESQRKEIRARKISLEEKNRLLEQIASAESFEKFVKERRH